MSKEKPYIIKKRVVTDRFHNPKYGEQRICECGHTYHRHFDTYEDMYPCGCKYCICDTFKEAKDPEAAKAAERKRYES